MNEVKVQAHTHIHTHTGDNLLIDLLVVVLNVESVNKLNVEGLQTSTPSRHLRVDIFHI